jgi:cell division initiation protein
MKLTPLDIQRKQFPVRWKGLDKKAVDSFLDLVREQIEEQSKENTLLREESSRKDQELAGYRETDLLLRNTLMAAQQMVEDYKSEARKEIEHFRRETELQANRTMQEAQKKVVMMQGDMTGLQRLRKHFQAELRRIIENHLNMLEADSGMEHGADRHTVSKI